MKKLFLGMLTVCLATLGAPAALAKAPPADARQPAAVPDLNAIFDQTAAVVEGEVTDVSFAYDDRTGPWTLVTLSGLKTHLGQMGGPQVTLRVRGGMLPDGHVIVVPELPSFVRGKRYVVFLRNTSWSWSPVLLDLSLRYETVAGKEVLIDSRGLPCVGVDAQGLRFGEKALFEGTREARVEGSLPAEKPGNAPEDVRAAVGGAQLAQQLKAKLAARKQVLDSTFFDEPRPQALWNVTPAAGAGGQRHELTAVPEKVAAPVTDSPPQK